MTTEASIEQACRRYAQSFGWVLLKIQGTKGYPDRLLISPHGRVAFIEFKRPGAVPSLLQQHILTLLRQMGHRALWTDNLEEFKDLMFSMAFEQNLGDPTSTKSEE